MPSKVSNLLKQNKVSNEPKSTKSKVPSATPHPSHDDVHVAYHAMKQAEAEFQLLEAELLKKASEIYAENAKDGSFSKSWNFPGIETAGVQVTYQDRFTAISDDREEALKEAVGEDYDKYFQESRQLVLADSSDENIEFLMKKLGKEKFFELFSVKLNITTKPDMDRRQFELPEAARSFLKQFKASVKLR